MVTAEDIAQVTIFAPLDAGARNQLARVAADISLQAGLKAARQAILVADSSKWQRSGFIRVTPFSSLDAIVTDGDLAADARAAVQRAGTDLILV